MPELFIRNPHISFCDLKDGIDERLSKVIAIHDAIMFQCFDEQGKLAATTDLLMNLLWIMKGILDELECLKNALYKLRSCNHL